MNIKEVALKNKRIFIIVAAVLIVVIVAIIIIANQPEKLYYDSETGLYYRYDKTGTPIPYELALCDYSDDDFTTMSKEELYNFEVNEYLYYCKYHSLKISYEDYVDRMEKREQEITEKYEKYTTEEEALRMIREWWKIPN